MDESLNLVRDLALIFISAGITTLIFRALKQPLILGYIVAGFLVGPHFGLFPGLTHPDTVEQWSEIGIIFLLFALGLEFSFKKLLKVGSSALITAGTIFAGMFVTGLALGWYLIVAVRLMVQDNALSGKAWIGLGALSTLLVLLQALTFFTPDATAAALDALCYGLMSIGILWLLVRCFRAVRLHEHTALSLTFGGYGWAQICLYMSSGVPHALIFLCITAMLPLMVVSVKRRVVAP